MQDRKKNLIAIFCLLVFAMGISSIYGNKVQLLPDIQPPKVSFSIKWPGASEDFLISDLVKPYEDAILGKLEGFERLKVTTRPEQANFEVVFEFGTDLYQAENELAALLARARALPLEINPLYFRHGGRNVSNRVVGSYFITSQIGDFTEAQLNVIRNLAKNKFELLSGVESVELNPSLENHLQIKLDMNRLFQLQLSYENVRNVVTGILSQPVTRLNRGDNVIVAKFKQTTALEDINQTPVAYVNGVTIRLKDVAEVYVGPINVTATARYQGQQAIAMRILRDADANLIDVQNRVEQVLQDEGNVIAASGLSYNLSFDTSLFIGRAIEWIVTSLLIGFLLTLVVSFVFFKRLQPTLLAGIVTLLSCCGVFTVLAITGTSINVISLAGITFATGMFVDGVLIFVEHLDREAGKGELTPKHIQESLKKLAPALIASSLTTIIVFAPVVFSEGSEGQLFKGLSLAITSGLVFSLVFTLLITPIFAERFMSPRKISKLAGTDKFNSVLRWLLQKRRNSLAVLLAVITGSLMILVFMFPSIGYLPSVKRDAVDVYIPLSGNERLEAVERNVVNPLNAVIQDLPADIPLNNSYVIGWPHFVTAGIRVRNNKQIPQLVELLKTRLKEQIPGKRIIVLQGELLGGVESRNDINLDLFVADTVWLNQNFAAIQKMFKDKLPGVSLRVTPAIDKQVTEYEFEPKLIQLRHMGVTDQALKNLVSAIGQSDFIGKWSYGEQVLNGYIGIKQEQRDIGNIPYVSSQGRQIYVSELLTVNSAQVLPSLQRIKGLPAATLSLRITDKALTVSDIVTSLNTSVLPELKALIGNKGLLELQGSAASLAKAKTFLLVMVCFVILAFLLIVAALFKSFRLSICVLISLVPALAGSVLGYQLLAQFTATDFNVLTLLGFVIMLGIVANNAILLVDAMRQDKSKMAITDTIMTGIEERTRAVVVSSLTTILGMLPLLLFPSEASQIYQGIAAIIVGGIGVNLITVLFVTAASVRVYGLKTADFVSAELLTPQPFDKVA